MSNTEAPLPIPSQVIRETLVKRAEAFVESHGSSLSAIGLGAVNDSKFLKRVKSGENFSMKTYQSVLDWMDEQDKTLAASKADLAGRVDAMLDDLSAEIGKPKKEIIKEAIAALSGGEAA